MKVKLVLLLLALFVFLGNSPIEASYDQMWEFEKPSPYPGRKYTHEQYIRLFVDDGFGNQAIYGEQMPVFCLPGTLKDGYTAVEIKDVLEKKPMVFAIMAGTGFEQKNKYFLVHNSKGNPYVKSVVASKENYVSKDPNAPGIGKLTQGPTDATWDDPYRAHAYKPYDVAWVGTGSKKGFYYGTTKLSGAYGGQVGTTNLTYDAAKALTTHNQKIQVNADIYVSYQYNLGLFGLEQVSIATAAGQKDTWSVGVLNYTPFNTRPERTLLRAFVQEEGKQPVQVASEQLAFGNSLGQYISNWYFSYTPPKNDFKVIVTVNKNYNGSWVNEPLVTEYANIPIYGANGKYETTYADNIINSKQVTGLEPPKPPGEIETPGEEEPPKPPPSMPPPAPQEESHIGSYYPWVPKTIPITETVEELVWVPGEWVEVPIIPDDKKARVIPILLR